MQIDFALDALEIRGFLAAATPVLLGRIFNEVAELVKSYVLTADAWLPFLRVFTKKSFSNACSEIVEIHFLCVTCDQPIKVPSIDNSNVKQGDCDRVIPLFTPYR